MSVALSLAALQSIHNRESPEAWLSLVTIRSPEMAGPLRFTTDSQPVTSQALVYTPLPMDVVLMSQEPGQAPEARLQLFSADQLIVSALDGLSVRPQVDLAHVLSGDLDTWIGAIQDLELVQIRVRLTSIEGRLVGPSARSEIFPAVMMNRTNTPALHA